MRRVLLGCIVAAAVFVGLLFAQPQPGAGKGKAREKGRAVRSHVCGGFVNQYLDALIAHNIFGLPLASRVRFTENAQVLDLGDGLWT